MNFEKKEQNSKEILLQIDKKINIDKCNDYIIADIQSIKNLVNSTKSKMDPYYLDVKNNENFSKILNSLRLTNNLIYYIKNNYNAQCVDRAWVKFYEIINHFNLVNNFPDKFIVFCNAELPGAGLTAINHYVKTHYNNINFHWIASSYVDDDNNNIGNNLLGDRYGLLRHNQHNWLMNKNNNGDVTSMDNILDWDKRIHELYPDGVSLYTSDAGIDPSISDNKYETGFNLQELKNAKIHFGAAVAGLFTLAIGGNIILKQYTLFESFSITMLIIYASYFEKFYLYKPMSSGASNSECYFVGIRFRGITYSEKSNFLQLLTNFNPEAVIDKQKLTIDYKLYFDEIMKFINSVGHNQIEFINESLDIYDKYKNNIMKLKNILSYYLDNFTHMYLSKNKITKIKSTDKINSN